MTSQAKIIKSFSLGRFSGCQEKPKHIVTVISNVFISGQRVYKIYKNDDKEFNTLFYDLSVKENRFKFTTNDFSWNHDLSPEVYLELRGILLQKENVVFTDPTKGVDELCIVMQKIDMHNALIIKLLNIELKTHDFYQIGYHFADRESKLPEISDSGLNLYQNFITRVRDVDEFFIYMKDVISSKETKKYVDYLYNFVEKHKVELGKAKHLIGTGIDIHSENAIYDHNRLYMIDTYPPKEDWRLGYKHINIYRLATDVLALRGEKEFREMLKGYQDFSKEKLDPAYEKFLVVYSSCIMVSYFNALAKHDPSRAKAAKNYLSFLRAYTRKV